MSTAAPDRRPDRGSDESAPTASAPGAAHLGGPLRPTDAATDDLGLRKLLMQTVLGLIGLLAIFLVVGAVFYQQLVTLGTWTVTHLGGPGLVIAFFVLDAVWLPIPHETFSGLALVGGMGLVEITAWATLGSLMGGAAGFGVAKRIHHHAWFQRFLRGRAKQAMAIVERYGGWGLAIGALTPLPYVWTTWAAGALDMPWRQFLPISLLRIPRIAFYVYLMQLGFLRL